MSYGEWCGRVVCFGSKDDEWGVATFDPRCPNCMRFIKFPKSITMRGDGEVVTKVRCTNCGLVVPDFIEYV